MTPEEQKHFNKARKSLMKYSSNNMKELGERVALKKAARLAATAFDLDAPDLLDKVARYNLLADRKNDSYEASRDLIVRSS